MSLLYPNGPVGGSGSSGGNVFVCRQDEPSPSGNVFATFAAAYTAAKAIAPAPATILVDSSLNPVYMGMGDFDLSGITLEGIRPQQADQIIFGDNTQHAASVLNMGRVKNLTMYNEANDHPPFFQGGETWELEDASINNNGSSPFITLDGSRLTLILERSAVQGPNCIYSVRGGQLRFSLYDGSAVGDDVLGDDGDGDLGASFDLSSSFGDQPSFTGVKDVGALAGLPPEFKHVTMAAAQTTGIAANAKVLFDTVKAQNGSTYVQFDAGTNRFTLRFPDPATNPGLRVGFKLVANMSFVDQDISFTWFDVTNNVMIGVPGAVAGANTSSDAVAFLPEDYANSNIVVELRLADAGFATRLGIGILLPWAYVETIGQAR